MSRITYNDLRDRIDSWNEGHPELPLKVYGDMCGYKVGVVDENSGAILETLVSETTTGRTWDSFSAFKKGYFTYERLIQEGKLQILQAKGVIRK